MYKLVDERVRYHVNEEYIERIYNVYTNGLIGVLKVFSHNDDILRVETDHGGNIEVLIALGKAAESLI